MEVKVNGGLVICDEELAKAILSGSKAVEEEPKEDIKPQKKTARKAVKS